MGKQSIFDKVREWLGGIAFDVFLWSARMTQDEYLDAVVRENGLTQRAVDCAYCHCTTSIVRDGVHCVNCGRVYKSHSH